MTIYFVITNISIAFARNCVILIILVRLATSSDLNSHICQTWKLNSIEKFYFNWNVYFNWKSAFQLNQVSSIEVTSIQLFKWVQLKSLQFNFSSEFSCQRMSAKGSGIFSTERSARNVQHKNVQRKVWSAQERSAPGMINTVIFQHKNVRHNEKSA